MDYWTGASRTAWCCIMKQTIQQIFDVLVIVNIVVFLVINKKMLCPPFKPQPALRFMISLMRVSSPS